MSERSLREFLKLLDNRQLLRRVSEEVNPRHELGALCWHNLRRENKSVLFTNVMGASLPVVTNLLSSEERISLALQVPIREMTRIWAARRTDNWPAPILLRSGSCQEVILEGGEVDLLKIIPQVIWNEEDSGVYVTSGVTVSKNQAGQRNVGIYRMTVLGHDSLSMMINPVKHMMKNYNEAETAGKPLQAAVCIGVDPVILMSAATRVDYGQDEFALAGAVSGEPLKLVRCRTVDLEVPATAELVLEGELIPRERVQDGPFGEVAGYYGEARPARIFRVKCVTHRREPIYHGVYATRPPSEGIGISLVPGAANAYLGLRSRFPEVLDLRLTLSGAGMTAYVSVKKSSSQLVEVMGTAMGEVFPQVKLMVVVDDDIDIYDLSQVEWAVATRTQPVRDYRLLPKKGRVPIDPSAETEGNTYAVIDATKPLGSEFAKVCEPCADLARRAELIWRKASLATDEHE